MSNKYDIKNNNIKVIKDNDIGNIKWFLSIFLLTTILNTNDNIVLFIMKIKSKKSNIKNKYRNIINISPQFIPIHSHSLQ